MSAWWQWLIVYEVIGLLQFAGFFIVGIWSNRRGGIGALGWGICGLFCPFIWPLVDAFVVWALVDELVDQFMDTHNERR